MTQLLRAELRRGGLPLLSGDAAVVPVILGPAERCVAVVTACGGAGVIAPAIRPPSVAEGSSRLRLTVSAGFNAGLVKRAAGAIVAAVASTA
jgi:8-amino-7-oxononanoate synthase